MRRPRTTAWRAATGRLRAFFGGRSAARELDEELHFHLEQEAERWLAAGASPAEARRRARLAFGGYDRIVEETREARGRARLENLWRDMRLGARALRRAPGFTAAAVLTLAVGIGATTAVFALANWVLLRPVPGVAAGHELVTVRFEDERSSVGISAPNYEDLRAAAPAFSGLVGESGVMLHVQAAGGDPVVLLGTAVLGRYFEVLGVPPERGRFFAPEELDLERRSMVAVISGRVARQLFGGADAALGATLRVNRHAFTVIGVAGGGFLGPARRGDTDVWLPVSAAATVRHASDLDLGDRRQGFFSLIGRLAPDATAAQAEAQLAAGAAALRVAYPEETAFLDTYRPRVHAGVGMLPWQRDRTERMLRLVLGIVFILLLIASANVASLLLGRALVRRGETAVRRALGASAGRIVQQHLAEALLLALLGSVAGLGVARLLSRLFSGQQLPGFLEIDRVGLDTRVVGFAVAAALLSAAFFAVLPALASARDVTRGVHTAGRGATRPLGARAALTVVQIAASLTLLVGALLLVRTVRSLQAVDLGFDAGVYAVSFTTTPQGWDAARAAAVNDALATRLRSEPGIEAATIASGRPFASQFSSGFVPAGGDARELLPTFHVAADYFATLRVPLLAGRTFTPDEGGIGVERGPPPGVVLSRSAATRLFGEADAVGRVVQQTHGARPEYPVIGVVEDVRIGDLRGPPAAVAYLPLSQWQFPFYTVLVRSPHDRAFVERQVDAARRRVAPELPLPPVEPLATGVRNSIGEERLLARLLTGFALLAAALAAIGLYGVVAYSVAQRRREIGIRMALGARGAAVVALVARQSLTLLAAGSLLGIAGGYALSRVLASRVFGVTPLDPWSYVAALAGFAAVAALASGGPALTAARVDPALTMKTE